MDQASVQGTAANKPQQATVPGTALEALAAALDPREFATALVTGQARAPRLTVISRRAHASHDVYIKAGWYWHAWAERIAPVTDTEQAADKVIAVLAAALPPLHRPRL